MRTNTRLHTEHKPEAGFTTVDCALTAVLITVMTATSFSGFSEIISPLAQKVIVMAVIWLLSLSSLGPQESR